MGKARVAVLATGGTIAGQAPDAGSAAVYVSGVLQVASLLEAVPLLGDAAAVTARQVASIGSEDMTERVWLLLREAILDAAGRHDIDGIVVLHGTDTMEETACFLDLSLPAGKPVVLTGAMRPANATSPDGPANILAAVRLAARPDAGDRGVLVVFNDRIFAARDVVKSDAVNLDAFSAPACGPIGKMLDDTPQWHTRPGRGESNPCFSLEGIDELPRVEIIYGHAGQRPDIAKAVLEAGVAGIVHAGVGAGNIHQAVKPVLLEAARAGVAVVAASRCAIGTTTLAEANEPAAEFINAAGLNPQKARVVLQLALTRSSRPGDIQDVFLAYGQNRGL